MVFLFWSGGGGQAAALVRVREAPQQSFLSQTPRLFPSRLVSFSLPPFPPRKPPLLLLSSSSSVSLSPRRVPAAPPQRPVNRPAVYL